MRRFVSSGAQQFRIDQTRGNEGIKYKVNEPEHSVPMKEEDRREESHNEHVQDV